MLVRVLLAWAALGVGLCAATVACGPSAAPPPTTPTADAFAVVRATAQAAYGSGRAALDQGDYLQACVYLDTARTNDPDNSPQIQQALDQALQHCLTPSAEPTSASAGAVLPVPTIVVPTAAALTPQPAAAPIVSPVAAGTPETLVMWTDPQGRLVIGTPPSWATEPVPHSFVGTSAVTFRDPTGRAELDVAVDTANHAVSPELYAATMEIAMQKQVPGYAGEQVQPGNVAGNPSIRRVFTFTQRDANGQDHQVRAVQVTIVRGSTPYLITGVAPADWFPQYSPTFDRILESFRFS